MPANRRKPSAPDYAAQAANLAGSYATPRVDYTGQGPAAQYTHQLQVDPNFTPPDGYSVHSNHVSKDPNGFMNFMDSKWAPILMAAGIGGLGFAPGGAFNSAAAGAGGGIPELPAAVEGWPSQLPGTVGGGSGAAGHGIGSKIMSGLSTGRKALGLDYTSLALGALSLLGGDDPGYQKRESFSGTAADPVNTLGTALNAIKNMGEYISTQSAPSFKSAVVPQGPSPVSIPGIPFQIGGGLGRDPAIADPSLLTGKNPSNPFKSTATPAKKRTL